jgi:uncharacterized cupredoxin-like copper-binding protein
MLQRSPRALCVAAALLLAACAPTEERVGAADTAAPAATTATTAPAPNEVTVRAADFAYEAPAQIPAGMTTFRLANDGPNFHHLQIVRLDSAKTFADLQQALRTAGPLPRWAVVVGGPNAPDPKTEANATLDMRPGRYALVCFVDVPGGVPHVAKGMIKELTVTPAAGGAVAAAAPSPDVVLTLRDYRFDFSKPLARGRQTIEVRTAANTQPHEVELIRLAPGKTAEQMLAWLGKPEGPPPGQGLGGVAATVPGSTNYFTAELTPGSYLLICFLPDAKDGKPHFMHGMTQTVTVS